MYGLVPFGVKLAFVYAILEGFSRASVVFVFMCSLEEQEYPWTMQWLLCLKYAPDLICLESLSLTAILSRVEFGVAVHSGTLARDSDDCVILL